MSGGLRVNAYPLFNIIDCFNPSLLGQELSISRIESSWLGRLGIHFVESLLILDQ